MTEPKKRLVERAVAWIHSTLGSAAESIPISRFFNLAYIDPFPPAREIQDLVPYWLWVLSQPPYVGTQCSADEFLWGFTPDPTTVDEAARPGRLRELIQKRVFDPLADFGLVEFENYAKVEYPPASCTEAHLRPQRMAGALEQDAGRDLL